MQHQDTGSTPAADDRYRIIAYVSPELDIRARVHAGAQRISVSELIRRLLDNHLEPVAQEATARTTTAS
jgi:hypothetical protein